TAEVRQVIHRVVEVDVVVVIIAVIITANVIRTTHGDHAVEEVGTAKELIGAVKRPEACAGCNDTYTTATTVPDVGHDFAADILVIFGLPQALVVRMHLLVEPGLLVDRVDREDFDATRFDHLMDGVNQLESFIL